MNRNREPLRPLPFITPEEIARTAFTPLVAGKFDAALHRYDPVAQVEKKSGKRQLDENIVHEKPPQDESQAGTPGNRDFKARRNRENRYTKITKALEVLLPGSTDLAHAVQPGAEQNRVIDALLTKAGITDENEQAEHRAQYRSAVEILVESRDTLERFVKFPANEWPKSDPLLHVIAELPEQFGALGELLGYAVKYGSKAAGTSLPQMTEAQHALKMIMAETTERTDFTPAMQHFSKLNAMEEDTLLAGACMPPPDRFEAPKPEELEAIARGEPDPAATVADFSNGQTAEASIPKSKRTAREKNR